MGNRLAACAYPFPPPKPADSSSGGLHRSRARGERGGAGRGRQTNDAGPAMSRSSTIESAMTTPPEIRDVRLRPRRSSSLCVRSGKEMDQQLFPSRGGQRIFPDARPGAARLAQSLRGSIHQRRVLRRPSDFSDLQHLGAASDGIKMTERQKRLLIEAYPSEEGNEEKRAAMAVRLHQRLLKCASAEQLQGIRLIFHEPNHFATFLAAYKAQLSSAQNTTSSPSKQHSDDIAMSFYHEQIAQHSRKIIEVLDMAISSLDSLDDSLGSYLTDLGAKHSQMDGPDNRFSTEYWDLFAQALCDVANTWKIPRDRIDTLCTWRIVVFFVTNKIRYGYDVESERAWMPAFDKPAPTRPGPRKIRRGTLNHTQSLTEGPRRTTLDPLPDSTEGYGRARAPSDSNLVTANHPTFPLPGRGPLNHVHPIGTLREERESTPNTPDTIASGATGSLILVKTLHD